MGFEGRNWFGSFNFPEPTSNAEFGVNAFKTSGESPRTDFYGDSLCDH